MITRTHFFAALAIICVTLFFLFQIPQPSPSQKISQLLAISLKISQSDGGDNKIPLTRKQFAQVSQLQPGFIILYGRQLSFNTVKSTTQVIRDIPMKVPVGVMVDHEGGLVQRLSGEGFTKLPAWDKVCQVDTESRRSLYQKSAMELRDVGIDIVLGPMVDWAHEPSSILGSRLCSGQSKNVLRSAHDVITIYNQNGLTPTLKHYPGIGSLNVDLHDTSATNSANPEELAFFHQLVDTNHISAVMSAHVLFLGDNKPCSLSSQCLDSLSRMPNVLVITDDIDMASLHKTTDDSRIQTLTELSKQAILAKNTIVLLGPAVTFTEVEKIVEALSLLYQEDPHFTVAVDEALNKINHWKLQKMANKLLLELTF